MSPAVLVLLHGHDDDPAAFTGFAEAAATALGPDTTVVVPLGPVETGGGRRAWWDAGGDDTGGDEDRGGDTAEEDGDDAGAAVAEAVAVLDGALADLAAADPGAPLVVGGFSQGAALVLTWLHDARRSVRPHGAFALAGWLEHTPTATPSATPPTVGGVDGVAVLVAYGEDDEVVPPPASRSAGRVLERAGATVTVTEVATGHTPVDAFLAPLRAWLAGLAPGR